jgi:hypothetical protein
MMALHEKERVLAAYWINEKTKKLADDFDSIGLEALAPFGDAGMISLRYEFKNYHDCSAWLKTQRDSSL